MSTKLSRAHATSDGAQVRRQSTRKDVAVPVGSKADERARRAAEHAGREAEQVERLPFDLSVLEEEGAFVNVDASGCGMLGRRLDWQALGIRLPENSDVAFQAPRCGVLPDRYRRPLLQPAMQAHAALHKYSYQFRLTETLFQTPAYRWLTWRAFLKFEEAFKAAQENLEAAKREVLKDYDAIRQEVIDTFTRLSLDSAQRLLATGTVVPPDFRERVTTSVLDALPTEDELREKLTLRFQLGVILLGSEMLREQRHALRERERLERSRRQSELKMARHRAEEQSIQQELWAQRESARFRLDAEREALRREAETKERIRQLKVEAAREKLAETLSPLQEGAAQLRAGVYESATAIHTALLRNGYLPGATAKKARTMAQWFRLMNFQSDKELEQLIAQLEGLAATKGGRRKRAADEGQIKRVLDDIIELTYRDAESLAAPSRTAALEL